MLDVKSIYCSKCDLYFTESIVEHVHISDMKEILKKEKEQSEKEKEIYKQREI